MYGKLSYILTAALAIGFASCSDQGDVVDKIVEEGKKQLYAANVEYTLTAADYSAVSSEAGKDASSDADKALASSVASTLSLNSFASADTYVPALLTAKYPALKGGSTAQITYAFTADRPEYLSRLASSPADIAVFENFEGYNGSASPYATWNQNGWKHFGTKGGGTKYWQIRAFSGNQYGQVTANGGVAEQTEIYVVSPAITLDEPENNFLSFDVCIGFWNSEGLSVLITEDDEAVTAPASATWTDITSNFTIPTTPTSGYGTFAPAGSMSLDAYTGKTIYIAFRYDGETGMGNPNRTTTYQIDNVMVANGDPDFVPEPGAAYIKDGDSWTKYADGISLTADDYKAMGLTSLSAAQAPSYLPAFLAGKFPYAQEGAKKAVLYTASTDEYTFSGGRWAPSFTPSVRTDQFVYGTSGWLFDPTVNYTMATADYQMMIDYMKADPAQIVFVNTQYNNEEFYYGFSSRYANVSFRLSYRTGGSTAQYSAPDTELHALSDPAAQAKLLWKRLIEKGLPTYMGLKWPQAVTDVQGIEVLYNLTVMVYYPDGVTYQATGTNYTFTYKVTKAGPAPTFEYVSGAPAEYYP